MHGTKKLSNRFEPAYSKLQEDQFYNQTILAALALEKAMPVRYDSPIPALKIFHDIFLKFRQFYQGGSRGLDSIIATVETKIPPSPFVLLNVVNAYTYYVNHINDAKSMPFSKQNVNLVSNLSSKRASIFEEMARLAELGCQKDRISYHDLDLIYGHFLLWINQIYMIKNHEEKSGTKVVLTQIGRRMAVFYEKILDILEPHISPESKFIRPYIAISISSGDSLYVEISELERSAEKYDPPISQLHSMIESLEDFENELVNRAHTLISEFTLCRGMLEAFSGKLLNNIFSFEKRTNEIRKLMNLFELFASLSNEASSLLPRIIESKRDWDSRPQVIEITIPCPTAEPFVDTPPEGTALSTKLENTLELLNLESSSNSECESEIIYSEENLSNETPLFEQIYPKKKPSEKSSSQVQPSSHPWALKLVHHKETLDAIFSNGPVHFRALSHLISALGGTTFSGSKGIKLHIPKAHLLGDPGEKGSLKDSIHAYRDGRKGQPVPQRIVHCMRDFLEQCNLTLPKIWPAEYPSQIEPCISPELPPSLAVSNANTTAKEKKKAKNHKR
ncbi:MAG: hypothetical protein U1E78_09250 [Gammaproteobacteria bacterium]